MAERLLVVFLGPDLILVWGRATVKVRRAAVVSRLPAASVANTVTVCLATLRRRNTVVAEHALGRAPLSRRQREAHAALGGGEPERGGRVARGLRAGRRRCGCRGRSGRPRRR